MTATPLPTLRSLAAAAALLCCLPVAALAQATAPAAAAAAAAADPATIYTHGEFRAVSQEQGSRDTFAHIKVAPGVKIPFSTITYRVRDAALLKGLQPGTRVEFRAERVEGENVLVAIRPRQP
ncbi:MAG: copper-binding protein [Pseudomonadota bacterium]